MPTNREVLDRLRKLFDEERHLVARIEQTKYTVGFADSEERNRVRLEGNLDSCHREMRYTIEEFRNQPSHHHRHFPLLPKFWELREVEPKKFEKSVFIMTKYPENTHTDPSIRAKAAQLQTIIDLVKDEIRQRNHIPRMANDCYYHPILWDNVELYLLGSKCGVAIVEDNYMPELNPNVAMEWGWMRAMGREVLFLCEQSFQHDRADWEGFLKEIFDWEDPQPGIRNGLDKLLT